MAEFDYDAVDDVSAETLAAITAEISGTGLKPLSDEERQKRQIEHEFFLAECYERDRQQRLEYERRQAEAAEAERAEAKRQAAIARAQAREKLKAELAEQSRRQTRDQRLPAFLTTRFGKSNSDTAT